MLNDRDDKPDDHEESEYHFSDDDISYEAEPESPKSAASGQHESIANRLSKSKRIIISASVFFVLVFIVYKVVTPSAPGLPADLSTPMVAANQAAPAKAPASAPAAPAQTQAAPAPAAVQQPVQPVVSQSPVVEVQAPPPTGQSVPATTTAQQVPAQQAPAPQAAMPQPTMIPPPPINQPQTQTVVSMPAVIPVQSTTPSVATTSTPPSSVPPSAVPPSAPTTTPVPIPPPEVAAGLTPPPVGSSPTMTIVQTPENSVDAKIASMEATNQRLINQLQSDYTQKINDYSAQNKALQDQIQTLNSRVSGMETQLNQIVQAVTRTGGQTQQQPPPPPINMQPGGMGGASMSRQLPPISHEIRTAFSVQAIIPGRAWLRSDNGETLTVAEGDSIKGLGRVTKIDPYDGVVEVNVGNRIVSLSYGNGAES
jgi:hypothetical protein